MNTPRQGTNTKNSTHSVFSTPDTEWPRNRSVSTWNRTMIQRNRRKNHNTGQKMSPNETSATTMAASLDQVKPSGTSTAAAEVIPLRQATVKSCGPPISQTEGL